MIKIKMERWGNDIIFKIGEVFMNKPNPTGGYFYNIMLNEKKTGLIVAVDDLRQLIDCDVVIRNFESAKLTIPNIIDKIDYLKLDHDLGEDKTGYDLLMWICTLENRIPTIELITSNPVGRERMKQCLIHDMNYKEISYGVFINVC